MKNNTRIKKDLDGGMKKEKIKSPGIYVGIMLCCIILSIADIVLLRDAFSNITGTIGLTPILLVVVFTALADFFAFEWGRVNGERMKKNIINKNSLLFFILWALMGVIFLSIRIINLFFLEDMEYMAGECMMLILLAVLYVGTGTGLALSFRNIFDFNSRRYRIAKKKFEKLHAECVEGLAEIQEITESLQSYGANYKTLEKQRNYLINMVENSRKSTADAVMGKIIQRNEYMDAEHSDKIIKEVLEER